MFLQRAFVAAVSCVMLLCAGEASAQKHALQAGTRELSVAGSVNDNDGLNMHLRAGAGYFFFDRMELGVIGSYSRADSFMGTWEALTLGVFAEYNFNLQTLLVPFVGVAASYADDNMEASSGIAVGSVSGGARYFVSDNVSIGGNLEFSVASEDIYLSGTDPEGFSLVENTDLAFLLETRVFF